MSEELRILIVEDVPSDADLAEREISKVIPSRVFKRVETRVDFEQALEEFKPDLIVSDYQMPSFNGMMALKIALELAPQVPFIMHTGSMNEDFAVECMKAGATDYVIKEHMKRLGPAVLRALELRKVRTDRLNAQQALSESELRFRRLTENADDLIYRFELYPEKKFSYVSPAATRITGYTPEEHYLDPELGMKMVHPDDQHLLSLLSSDEEAIRTPARLRWIRKNGEVIWTEQRNVPIYNEKGQLIALEGISRDITERKRSEEALQRAKEKAEESDQLKTAFLNNLSHEIRTPLNAIVGFSEFLNEPGITREQIGNFTRIIRSSSDQLLSIIDDIVNISKIEAGQIENFDKKCDINKVLNQVYNLLLPKTSEKQIKFRFHTGLNEKEAMVITDQAKLEQVLYHLVGNAVKFTDEGHVEFGCSLKEDFLRFYVADTGAGIEPAHQEIVFQRFHQTDTGERRVKSGMGLGLPIAKAFVERLGGQIWMESNPGAGTMVFFTVPWRPETAPVISKDKGSAKGSAGHKTILVAEDEENNFELLRVILSSSDMEIIHAWDGKQALEYVNDNPGIDMVLMDIKMPVMGGYEATRKIKALKPDLPVVALTAYALPGDREKALDAGCDDYMAKPVSLKEFLRVVNKYL
jgi:PAS domain S-box-containing protein